MNAETSESTPEIEVEKKPLPVVRLSVTGVFMGLANLVPGVSGGTMVLALGLYDEFIGAVSDLTRFRISPRPIVVLGLLFGISAATIVLCSTLMQYMMEMFLPGMLGLFIGMTLGGAPLLLRDLKPVRWPGMTAAIAGIAIMAVVAFVLRPDTTDPTFLLFFLGGIVGSAAMILPGISGSYLLLILGLYLPIIGGISNMVDALRERDMVLLFEMILQVALPVGLGVLTGIVTLANLLKFFLNRYHKPTIGFLLGLLLGSVLGLYPFQQMSLDKLPRHAVAAREEKAELLVHGFGWQAVPGNRTFENLKALESDTLRVTVLSANSDAVPTDADVIRAREGKAVIVAYDVSVPREVRRMAADDEPGEVELVLIPDAEFTLPKAALVILLIAIGFGITFSMGKWGEGREG